MAASFIMSVPVVVLFLVLQRYFVRALTEGAVKSLTSIVANQRSCDMAK